MTYHFFRQILYSDLVVFRNILFLVERRKYSINLPVCFITISFLLERKEVLENKGRTHTQTLQQEQRSQTKQFLKAATKMFTASISGSERFLLQMLMTLVLYLLCIIYT